MFGTPKAVYQSSNINQLSPELGNIAYQVNDSLLAGNNVSSTYTLNNTVALNYGITGNQSDKLSSGYSVNILAQQSAKTLADVSAKIYANQSPKFTGYQSGEYFLGQSAKHFANLLILTTIGGWDSSENLKCGEFTPFAKGDFSHLSKEANYPHWQGLIGVTTQGRIEFFESIKKGSQSATLGNVDIKYRASQKFKISNESDISKGVITKNIHIFDGYHLRLLLNVGYSDQALAKSSVRICTLNIVKATHDAPSVFFCVHAYAHLLNAVLYRPNSTVMLAGQPKGWLVSFTTSSANPVSVTTPIEICTSSGDSCDNVKEIIVMMATPTQTQFKFLFLSIKRSDTSAKPCRITVTAPNEHDARLMLVRDYILAFAGRVPVQGVTA
ncbi:host cell division inhibitor Icd-like protein [Proteus vulgaris]|nr:host cell division inhibitor Icd-like protein [Proteus vulgaris]